MWAIAQQRDRIRSINREDPEHFWHVLIDFDFLVVSLRRLRRVAGIARKVPTAAPLINQAIDEFDRALPDLKQLRDVAEHADEYAVDNPKRHDKSIDRTMLEVASLSGTTLRLLNVELDLGVLPRVVG